MKHLSTFAAIAAIGMAQPALCAAEQAPAIFKGLLQQDQPVKGQVGMVVPPPEIDKYIAKVEAAAVANAEWFREYSDKTTPGQPLPYHENLGLTKEEYNDYIALWNKREFKPVEEVMLLLRKNSSDAWTITATGKASTLSTLRYHPDKDVFRSPNGELQRLEDIKAQPSSILGEWVGREWRFEEETSLGKTKENLAIGQYTDGAHGLIVYRVQELSSIGTRLLDKSLVIRFALAKKAAAGDQ